VQGVTVRKKQPETNKSVNSKPELSPEARFFLEPSGVKHRQYEALRGFFVDGLSAKQVGETFGYTPGSFHVLAHKFKKDSERIFFAETKPGPKFGSKRDQTLDRVVALRKKNYSVDDIHVALQEEGIELSTSAISVMLKDEGFAKLPRRRDKDRPVGPRPDQAEYADIRQLSFEPRVVETRFGGAFLLMRTLADMKAHEIPKSLNWYGSKMIPTENAFVSSLLLKIIGKERRSHVADLVFDQGTALAAGLNFLPKTSYICEYSERITHNDNLQFLHRWLRRLRKGSVLDGDSFNLDFQSLPYFGEDDVIEKHYVSMRSRRQKAVLVFFAQDAKSKIFCYSNADLRKGEENDEIFRFIEFWRKQTGKKPPHLVFDSKLTTYGNLSRLNKMNITFVTLRRRTPNVLKEISGASDSAWRKIELKNVQRKFRTPKVIDRETELKDYSGNIRQVFVKDLGHDLPTVLLTNDKWTSCSELISRYASRMLIENEIANGVDFFHTTALSSSVAIRIDFDVLLTLVGQATYRILASRLRGYENSGASVIFRKFVDTPAKITIRPKEIEVRLNKRANNPILLHSGLLDSPFRLPWLQNKQVRITLR
jgi:arginine repressor